MRKTIFNKLAKGIGCLLVAVFRRHLFLIHFFYETYTAKDFFIALKFILLNKNKLDEGPYLKEYQLLLKKSIDENGDIYLFGAGRMALYALLEAMDIGNNDEVIIPAFTCEVVVHALLYRKIRPIYADIDLITYNISPGSIESLITSKTKAIIAQHSFGVPCEIEAIVALAKKHSLRVIEDCALALGSIFKGRSVGTFGDAAFFSTDRTKMISTLWGGAAFTKDKSIANKLAKIYQRCHHHNRAQIKNMIWQVLSTPFLFSPNIYFLGRILFNYLFSKGIIFYHRDDKTAFQKPSNYPCRLSNFQAALGINQLARLTSILQQRKSMISKYLHILNNNGIDLSYKSSQILRFCLLYKNRDEFKKKWGKYFEVQSWFDSPALGWYNNFKVIGYIPGSCPRAEFVHQRIINFPTLPRNQRTENYLLRIIDTIKAADLEETESFSTNVNNRNQPV
jgi:perosamine synthetase